MTPSPKHPPYPYDDAADGPQLPPDYDPQVPSREAILRYLRNSEGPVAPKELAKALNTSYPFSTGVSRRLAAMERDGQLFFNPQGALLLNTQLDFIAGKVQGHRDGFGFL